MSFAETFPHQVIVGDGKPALYADISEAEFYAIGKMTTSWAILEHAMMATALRLGKECKAPTSKGFAALPIVWKLIKLATPAKHKPAIPKNFTTLSFETR